MNSFLTFSQFSSLVILFSISNGFLFKHFWPNIQFNIVLLIGPYQDNTLADGWLSIQFLIAIYWADVLIECNSTKIGLTQHKTESYVGPKYWAWQGLISKFIYFQSESISYIYYVHVSVFWKVTVLVIALWMYYMNCCTFCSFWVKFRSWLWPSEQSWVRFTPPQHVPWSWSDHRGHRCGETLPSSQRNKGRANFHKG